MEIRAPHNPYGAIKLKHNLSQGVIPVQDYIAAGSCSIRVVQAAARTPASGFARPSKRALRLADFALTPISGHQDRQF
jgi:hypothetical protein